MRTTYCFNPNCCNPAKFWCGRCNTVAYCGKECQVVSFPEHRTSCFELPQLKPIATASNESNKEMPSMVAIASEVKAIQQVNKVRLNAPLHETPLKVIEPPQRKDSFKVSPRPEVVERKVEPPYQAPLAVPKPAAAKPDFSMLRRAHSTIPSKPKEEPKIFMKDMTCVPLPEKKFNALVLDGKREEKVFTITEDSDSNKTIIENIEAAVKQAMENDNKKPYKPDATQQEIVMALYEGVFYRACCLGCDGDSYLVSYIDYGNTATVKPEEIRPISKKLASFEVTVHECFLRNLPDTINDDLANSLTQGILSLEHVVLEEEGYSASIAGL